MTVLHLAGVYAGVGVVAAVALLVVSRGRRLVDAAMLLALWPLAGPFLLLGDAPAPPLGGADDGREAAFLAALRGAATTPLGGVLPDQATARALATRLRVAGGKVRELDAVLARPALQPAAVQRRIDELAARGGSSTAQATAALHLQTVARLAALRRRYVDELDEVGELIAQLTTQAELLRLAGSADPAAADLVRELVARVEGLDHLLAEDVGPDVPESAAAGAGPAVALE